jgi:hypothetical protein
LLAPQREAVTSGISARLADVEIRYNAEGFGGMIATYTALQACHG